MRILDFSDGFESSVEPTASPVAASAISNTPSGNLAATNVQAALNELQSDIDTRATSTSLSDHISDSSSAHAASAIANTPSGNLAATDVQSALNEIQSDIDTRATSSSVSDHISDSSSAHAASAISNTPSGNLAATDVQGALNELQSSIDTALTNPMTTGGDVIYGGASGVATRLANGSSGQILTSSGGTSAPTWTTKGPVGFTARNYSNGTLTSGSTHTVVFNTVARDDNSAYNSSTGEYKVPFTGWCVIESEIGMAATAATATRQLFSYIRVNGAGISNIYTYAYTTNTITHRVYNSIQWYCTADDIITIVVENDLGATGTPQTGTGNSHFSVMLFV